MATKRKLDQKLSPFYYKNMQGMNTKTEQAELDVNFVRKAQNARFNKIYGSIKKREPLRYYNSTEEGTSPVDGVFRYYTTTGITKLIMVSGGKVLVGNDNAGTFASIRTLGKSGKRPAFVVYKNLLIGSDGYNKA